VTILFDPVRRNVFTDEAVFPLHFSEERCIDVFAARHTLVAGISALHHHADGICAEDGAEWPCKTVRILRASGASQ